VPVLAIGLSDVVAIEAGGYHACAVKSAGELFCWGDYELRTIGDASLGSFVLTPTLFTWRSGAGTDCGGGGLHGCIVLVGGSAECAGVAGDWLGAGMDLSSDAPPTPVVGTDISPVSSIDANFRNTCALGTTGDVRCWGEGDSGQLGNGDTSDSDVPISVIWAG